MKRTNAAIAPGIPATSGANPRGVLLALALTLALLPVRSSASAITSDFEINADGWSTSVMNFWSNEQVSNPLSVLDYSPLGGNIRGVWVLPPLTPTGGYFVAPAKFLGDRSASYQQTLSYDLRGLPFGYQDGAPEIILSGSGLTLFFKSQHPQVGYSNHYDIPLAVVQDEDSFTGKWRVYGTDLQPTQAEFLSVLENLSGLLILGSSYGLIESSDMDNVVLNGAADPGRIPIPGSLALLSVGLAGLNWSRRRSQRTT